jgi:hypothetical protein
VPRDPALNANWDKISEQSKILCRSLKVNIANAFLQEVAKLTQPNDLEDMSAQYQWEDIHQHPEDKGILEIFV